MQSRVVQCQARENTKHLTQPVIEFGRSNPWKKQMNNRLEKKIFEHQKRFRCWFWTVTLVFIVAPALSIVLLSCFCAESCCNKILTPLCISILACGIIEIIHFGFDSANKYKSEKEEFCLKILSLLTRIRYVSRDAKLYQENNTDIKSAHKDQTEVATETTAELNDGWNDVYKLVEEILENVYLFLENHSLFTMSDEYIKILNYCAQAQIVSLRHIRSHNYSKLRELYFKYNHCQIPSGTASYTLRTSFENLKKEYDYIDSRNDFDTTPLPQYFFIDRNEGAVHTLMNLNPSQKDETLLKPEICIRKILTGKDQKLLIFQIIENAYKSRKCVLAEKQESTRVGNLWDSE